MSENGAGSLNIGDFVKIKPHDLDIDPSFRYGKIVSSYPVLPSIAKIEFSNGQLSFWNLSHLSKISPLELLAIQLL